MAALPSFSERCEVRDGNVESRIPDPRWEGRLFFEFFNFRGLFVSARGGMGVAGEGAIGLSSSLAQTSWRRQSVA